MLGSQSRLRDVLTCLLPTAEPTTAFQGRVPPSSTLTDTAQQPHFFHMLQLCQNCSRNDGQLSGEAELGVSFGNTVVLSRALKDGEGNLLIINFLTRFLATFVSCPSWKCYENIFSRGILSLPISDSKWENISSNIREVKKMVH